MRNCENCGLEIPNDAISCDYCGQKVRIKTHSSPSAPERGGQSVTYSRDAEEGKDLPSSPTQPITPDSSAKNRNPLALALLIVTVIFALIVGGVITVYAYWHPTSTVTRTPVSSVTPKPGSQVTATVNSQITPTSSRGNPVPITVNVNPNGFSQTSCPQNSDASWTCTAIVTETTGSQGVNWSVTSTLTAKSIHDQAASLMPV